jgi:hypothetical protein
LIATVGIPINYSFPYEFTKKKPKKRKEIKFLFVSHTVVLVFSGEKTFAILNLCQDSVRKNPNRTK